VSVTGFGSPAGPVLHARPIDGLHRPKDLSDSATISADFDAQEDAYSLALVDITNCVMIDPGTYATDKYATYGNAFSKFQIVTANAGSICLGVPMQWNVVYYMWDINIPNGSAPTDSFKVTWTPISPGASIDTTDISVTADLQFVPGTNAPQQPPPPPTLSFSGGDGNIWWFGGKQPNGGTTWPTEIMVAATDSESSGVEKPYTWYIAATADGAAQFVGLDGSPLGPKPSTQNDFVDVQSLSPSTPGGNGKDIQITATFTNSSGTSKPSKPLFLTIREPYKLVHQASADSCVPAIDAPPDLLPNATGGWYCKIYYQTVDQLNLVLPANTLDFNEYFSGETTPDWKSPPYPAEEKWAAPTPCNPITCENQPANMWNDNLGAGNVPGSYPTAVSPGGPPVSKVFHIDGGWRFGDNEPGQGVLVQTNTWQYYTDHGVHCGVLSPTDGTAKITSSC